MEIATSGTGAPLLYLHGFADVHAAAVEFLPFHDALARSFQLIAPAHPCCAGSEEDEDIETIDDLAFRYIETMDALGLDKADIAGACVGGWIAAEIAVRHPERVGRLALIGASGLFLADHPIGDLFWETQPVDGSNYAGLRRLLFAQADAPEAVAMFPDSRLDRVRELSRYKTMRFASRIGFDPPYFYNRKLRARLGASRGRCCWCGARPIAWCRPPTPRPIATASPTPRCASSPARDTARRSSGPMRPPRRSAISCTRDARPFSPTPALFILNYTEPQTRHDGGCDVPEQYVTLV